RYLRHLVFSCAAAPRDLHPFPTRRSSDLASLWAAVPHYVSLTPSPRAAKALVDRLAELLQADVDTAELDEAADAYAQQVSEAVRSEEHTSELQSRGHLVCRLLLEKKKKTT